MLILGYYHGCKVLQCDCCGLHIVIVSDLSKLINTRLIKIDKYHLKSEKRTQKIPAKELHKSKVKVKQKRNIYIDCLTFTLLLCSSFVGTFWVRFSLTL